MPPSYYPGSLGRTTALVGIDPGTTCLAQSPAPTTVGAGALLLQGRVFKDAPHSERITDVIEAYRWAGELAPQEVWTLIPSRSEVIDGLVAGVEDMVKEIAWYALAGAVGLGVAGLLVAGPPGAVAGAVAGWSIGAGIGTFVVTARGLASLVVNMGKEIDEIVNKVVSATKRAWEAAEYPNPRHNQEVFFAAWDLARAMALLLKYTLMIVVAVLLKKGLPFVKQQAKLLSEELRGGSRFGKRLAEYTEENAPKMVEDVQLKPKPKVVVGGESEKVATGSHKTTPIRARSNTSTKGIATEAPDTHENFDVTQTNQVTLRVKRPRILDNPKLSPEERAYLTKDFQIKEKALRDAAARGELVWSPDTKKVRVSKLQSDYRDAVKTRFLRRYGRELDLTEFNADHGIDLIVGGSPHQRLNLINQSINKSVGSALNQAGKKARLLPGEPIKAIIFEP